jgi:hypothetical protein
MTSNAEADKELVRQVVRGERPWTDLRTIGIDVQLAGNHCIFQNPRNIEVCADIHDLAKGFLAHLHDARQLREWAFVLEASDVELGWEDHPAGETLLNALWSASFGEPIGTDVIKTLEQLA